MVPGNCASLVFKIKNLSPAEVLNVELDNRLEELVKISNLSPVEELSVIDVIIVQPVSLECLVLDKLAERLPQLSQELKASCSFLQFALDFADLVLDEVG